MQIDPTAALVAGMFGSGVMALLAISFGVVERSGLAPMKRSIVHGLMFGSGAILVMLEPVQLGEGVIFDARAIIVGMAGAFGGGPAALLAAALTASYRAYLGGVGAPSGVFGIFLAAGLGLLWAWRFKPTGKVGLRENAILGGMISLYTFSAVLLPYAILVEVLVNIVPVLVVGCIVGAIVMGSLMDRERRYIRSETHWREDALTDPLTALPNRRGFSESVEQRLSDRRVIGSNALLVLDADHFKTVNDRFGHPAGDAALVVIADKLSAIATKGGSVCRLGGEEFAVFLPKASRDDARQVAEVIRRGICDAGFVHAGVPVPLSVSIGAVMCPARSNATFVSLLQSADDALYRAKAGGRNQVVFAEALSA